MSDWNFGLVGAAEQDGIRGEWRCIEDDRSDVPLPGPRGRLTVVFTGTSFLVYFQAENWTSYWNVHAVRIDGDLVVVETGSGRVAFAPARSTKRKRVPVPDFPGMTSYVREGFRGRPNVRHLVASVEKVPDPNRRGNGEDALVVSCCGERGWVQPRNMDAVDPDAVECDRCVTTEPAVP